MQVKQGSPADQALTAFFTLLMIVSIAAIPITLLTALVTGEWRWLLGTAAASLYLKLVFG
jgi:hypothetical protein